MKIFLKLKNWQLFLLGFVVSIIGQIDSHTVANSHGNFIVSITTSPFAMLFYLFFMGWPLIIGTNLFKLLPQNTDRKIFDFKIASIVLLSIFTLLYLFGLFVPLEQQAIFIDSNLGTTVIFIIICVAVYYVFYSIYFIAKELKSVEMQRTATWSDYSGTFFLLWFSPIGIWWIQPRINKIFSETDSPSQME